MTIDAVLEAAIRDDFSEVDSSVLESSDVKESLTAFFSEQEVRGDLVSLIRLPRLLDDYLALDLEGREVLERLRAEKPEYLEGDLETSGFNSMQIRKISKNSKNIEEIIKLYNNINLNNALTKIINYYDKHQPISKYGPVSFQTFLSCYDVVSGKKLTKWENGKTIRLGRSQGNNFYSKFLAKRRADAGLVFEDWVRDNVSEESYLELMECEYYEAREFSLEDCVRAYVEFQPSSIQGPISFRTFLAEYDVVSGKSLIKMENDKITRLGKPQGNKFYARFIKEINEDSGLVFEDWVRDNVSEELYLELLDCGFYKRLDVCLEDCVRAYIKLQPSSIYGLVSFQTFLVEYDVVSGKKLTKYENGKTIRLGKPQGNKFYAKFIRERKTDSSLVFDDWVRSNVSEESYLELMECEYYEAREFSLEDCVRAYVEFQPSSIQGLVSFRTFLVEYDVVSGKRLTKRENGKTIRLGTPQGSKFYQRFSFEKKNDSSLVFEDHVKNEISEELYSQLMNTAYYRKD